MAIPVTCPGCSARMNAPDAAAGKKVKCPKCQKVLAVPELVVDAPAFEVVEDEPTQPVKKPAPRPAAKPQVKADVVVDEDDEDEVRPAKKRARAVVEDGEDDRPRKKKKKSAAGGSSLARNIVGGVVLVILLGVVVFVFWDKFGKKEEVASNTPPAGDPPAGPRPGPQGPSPGPQGPVPNAPGVNPAPGTLTQKLRDVEMGGPRLTDDGTLLLGRHVTPRGLVLGIWDVRTGNQFTSVGDGKNPSVDAYGISPDRKQVAIVSHSTRTMTLWSVPDARLEKTFKLTTWADGTRVPSFAEYTPDGKAVVTAYESTLLRVDVQTGTEQALLKDIDTLAVRYYPENNLAVVSGANKSTFKPELRVLDINRPGATKVIELKEGESVEHPDLSADGKTLVARIAEFTDTKLPPTVRLYDVASGQLKAKIPFVTADVPNSFIDDVRIRPDGNGIVFLGRVWRDNMNVHSCWVADAAGKKITQLGDSSKETAQITRFAGDGKMVIVLMGYKPRVYNTETGKDVTP